MAMSADYMLKFAALHWIWWRLYTSEEFSGFKWDDKPQTNRNAIIVSLSNVFFKLNDIFIIKRCFIIKGCYTAPADITPRLLPILNIGNGFDF